MRHRKRNIKLGMKSAHRDAVLKNLVSSLILHEKIETTKSKAKAARSLADKVLHIAITGSDTHNRRRAFQLLGNKEAVKHLFDEIAGKFKKSAGGYTRIVPYKKNLGDNAEKVFFMLSFEVTEKEKKKSTMKLRFKKKKDDKEPEAKAAASEVKEETPAEETAEKEASEETAAEPEAETSAEEKASEEADEASEDKEGDSKD